jgi:sec-independent protein translocase protein TatB
MRGKVSLAFMGIPSTIQYASLGMADSLILMIMALVVFGPRRLPQIGRQIGKLMYEFRKASNDFKFQMEEELRNAEEADRRKKEEERLRTQAAQNAAEQASVSAPAPVVNSIESSSSSDPYPPQDSAAAAPAAEESTSPRITAPTTGETVPAERPSRVTGSIEDATGNAAELGGPENGGQGGSGTAPASQAATEEHKDTAAEALNQHG